MGGVGNQAAGTSASSGWLAHKLFALAAIGGAALLFWPSFATLDAAPAVVARPPAASAIQTRPVIAPLAGPEQPQLQLTAALGRGDSFARMLQRAGIGGSDAERATALVAAETPLDRIADGAQAAITLGRRDSATVPRPLERLAFRPRLDLALTLERRDGVLTAIRQPIAVTETPRRIRGIAGASLYRSARAAGVPASAVQQYLQALDRRLVLERDVLPSDEFDMIVVQRRAATGESEAGALLYAGLDRGGQPQARLLRWGDRFFDAAGDGERSAAPALPVAGRITSGFGLRRHPILGFTRMHSGLDIRAGYGAPVRAASEGVVAFAGRHGGHGNFVRLAHGGGVGSGYAHLSRIAVAPGMRVRQGEVIGFVGSSGLSTGPHLHYEFYRGGRPVDPRGVQLVGRDRLQGEELTAFRARLAELRRLPLGLYPAET